MTGTAEAAALYSTIEESARLLDVPCSRENVWPILAAYADSIPQAVIALRVATGERYAGDLDWRFTVPTDVDPHVVAVSRGLIPRTDHPISGLLSEIRERCPIGSFGVDFGVVGGFKKIYAFFPPDEMQRLSTLVDLPSMPRSLAKNVGFFARHGLEGDKVNVFGIDYRHRTVNVYIGALPAEFLEPKAIQSMLREIDLPEASELMLRLGRQAFGIYVTLGWDSLRIKRFCFAVMTPDSKTLPVRIDPRVERFLSDVSYEAGEGRFIYYAGVSATDEEHYKLQSYFKWHPRMLDQMLLSDSADNRG